MLNVIHCRQPEDKLKILDEFNPSAETWVVSDLQSKWHVQKRILDQRQVLEGDAVLRATDLWKHFALQLIPDVRFLSPELAQTLFWDWVEPLGLSWAKSPQAIPVLKNQMQMWMSIFADPGYAEIMAQWFADNPESYVRWGHWFELCAQIWQRCQEQNLVMVDWLPAVLLNQDLGALNIKKDLTFDLGPQISQVEGLLIRALGALADVRLIYPEAPWVSLMKNALRPYEDLLSEPYRGDLGWQPRVDQSLKFARYSTQLAEVKDTVSRVRALLDQGIVAQKIAIVAPDIEHYWAVLQLYFQQEGIPICKPTTARLGSFMEMARWLATLRTSLAKVSSADLEVHFFGRAEAPALSFDEFRILFSHVYDASDLGRARSLFDSKDSIEKSVPQTVQEFLIWALKLWSPVSPQSRLLALLQVIGQEVPQTLELLPSQWLSYFEGLIARREIALRPAHESGVWCVSMSSADWLDVTHGVFLNLSEGALRRTESSPVTASEAQKIFTDTGFALGTTDRQELEFELLWFLNREWVELQLNFANTDFQGSVQTPSRFWMWAGFTNDNLKLSAEMPGVTRWDQIQHGDLNAVAELRSLSPAHRRGLEMGLERDLNNQLSTWKRDPEVRISASSLERYWECPFIFAAQRKLKLSDDPVLDLDLDRRTRGNLLHALVEELLGEPGRTWSDLELAHLVDETRERQKIRVGDERLWSVVRSQHVRLGRLFLNFENAWRARFPLTQTAGREVDFKCYWDIESARPVVTPTPILISGRVDRVDRDSQGRYALIDYKASAGSLTNWASWQGNRQIQLALYSSLIELGLLGLEKGPVVAANYYVVKDSDRRKGFHLKDPTSELYSSEDRHRNFITDLQKNELYAQLLEEIQAALTEIVAGHLNPHPVDEKKCGGCAWRTLCRAPHLN